MSRVRRYLSSALALFGLELVQEPPVRRRPNRGAMRRRAAAIDAENAVARKLARRTLYLRLMVLHARFTGNEQAIRLIRRKIRQMPDWAARQAPWIEQYLDMKRLNRSAILREMHRHVDYPVSIEYRGATIVYVYTRKGERMTYWRFIENVKKGRFPLYFLRATSSGPVPVRVPWAYMLEEIAGLEKHPDAAFAYRRLEA